MNKMYSDYALIAFRSLVKRQKRSWLTILGIFIGIAAVVALISIGQGLQNAINDQFSKVGADKIIIMNKAVVPSATGEGAGGLTQHDLDLVEKVSGVKSAAGALNKALLVKSGDKTRIQTIMSFPNKKDKSELLTGINSWEAETGRMLKQSDTGKAVIGYDLANEDLFGKKLAVGNKLLINGTVFEIVGTLKHMGDPGTDGSVILPESDLRFLVGDADSFSTLYAQSATGADPSAVADKIERAIRRDRHLAEGKENFVVQTALDMIEIFNNVFDIVKVVLIGIAAISLVVGGIGIMNTMYTAVLERTREIGIMKAVGARNSSILAIFLTESGALGLAGGIVGVIAGIGISELVVRIATAYIGPGILVSFYPSYLIIGALAFAFLTGAISGVLPARQAANLKPVDALRYD